MFSLVWMGVAIAVSWGFVETAEPVAAEDMPPPLMLMLFPLFGLPFFLAGVYMVFGRLWHDAKRRACTYYGITNQRIVVVSGIRWRKIKSINLRTISDMTLTEHRRDGTITFGPVHPMAWMFNMSWPGMDTDVLGPRLERIENAREVYRILTEAQKAA
jgi:hypothetical protein